MVGVFCSSGTHNETDCAIMVISEDVVGIRFVYYHAWRDVEEALKKFPYNKITEGIDHSFLFTPQSLIPLPHSIV